MRLELICPRHKEPRLRTRAGKPYCRKCQAEYTRRYLLRVQREIEEARWENIWQRHADPHYYLR